MKSKVYQSIRSIYKLFDYCWLLIVVSNLLISNLLNILFIFYFSHFWKLLSFISDKTILSLETTNIICHKCRTSTPFSGFLSIFPFEVLFFRCFSIQKPETFKLTVKAIRTMNAKSTAINNTLNQLCEYLSNAQLYFGVNLFPQLPFRRLVSARHNSQRRWDYRGRPSLPSWMRGNPNLVHRMRWKFHCEVPKFQRIKLVFILCYH